MSHIYIPGNPFGLEWFPLSGNGEGTVSVLGEDLREIYREHVARLAGLTREDGEPCVPRGLTAIHCTRKREGKGSRWKVDIEYDRITWDSWLAGEFTVKQWANAVRGGTQPLDPAEDLTVGRYVSDWTWRLKHDFIPGEAVIVRVVRDTDETEGGEVDAPDPETQALVQRRFWRWRWFIAYGQPEAVFLPDEFGWFTDYPITIHQVPNNGLSYTIECEDETEDGTRMSITLNYKEVCEVTYEKSQITENRPSLVQVGFLTPFVPTCVPAEDHEDVPGSGVPSPTLRRLTPGMAAKFAARHEESLSDPTDVDIYDDPSYYRLWRPLSRGFRGFGVEFGSSAVNRPSVQLNGVEKQWLVGGGFENTVGWVQSDGYTRFTWERPDPAKYKPRYDLAFNEVGGLPDNEWLLSHYVVDAEVWAQTREPISVSFEFGEVARSYYLREDLPPGAVEAGDDIRNGWPTAIGYRFAVPINNSRYINALVNPNETDLSYHFFANRKVNWQFHEPGRSWWAIMVRFKITPVFVMKSRLYPQCDVYSSGKPSTCEVIGRSDSAPESAFTNSNGNLNAYGSCYWLNHSTAPFDTGFFLYRGNPAPEYEEPEEEIKVPNRTFLGYDIGAELYALSNADVDGDGNAVVSVREKRLRELDPKLWAGYQLVLSAQGTLEKAVIRAVGAKYAKFLKGMWEVFQGLDAFIPDFLPGDYMGSMNWFQPIPEFADIYPAPRIHEGRRLYPVPLTIGYYGEGELLEGLPIQATPIYIEKSAGWRDK